MADRLVRRGRCLPLSNSLRPSTTEPLVASVTQNTHERGCGSSHPATRFRPRSLFPVPREKKRVKTTRCTFLRTAALLQSQGPTFAGARASRPLSHPAASPPRRVSRHPFGAWVSRRAAFPRGCAHIDVPDPLGPRARFRALCLTLRFFEPGCRRTNFAVSLLDARARSSSSHPRPRRHGVDAFPPNHRSPEGAEASHSVPRGVAPRHLRVGARAPEANPERSAMNDCGSGDPSEGPAEAGSPPQAPPGRPGYRLDLR